MIVPLLVLPPAALIVKAFSIAVCWAPVSPPALVVVTDEVASVAVGRSVRSRSVKVIDPASLTVPVMWARRTW